MGNGSPALLEGFENPFQQARFHTDAGIAHDELEIGAIAHPPGFPDAEVHAAPFRGKFQRIGQNIDKHLIEAQGIAPVALVHHAFDVQVKDNVLVFRLRIDERTDALHERPEIEFFIDDGYFTALDARHVQNVVDQREEVTGRKPDLAEAVGQLVPVVQRGGGDGGHADDRVHGRADLVAHP